MQGFWTSFLAILEGVGIFPSISPTCWWQPEIRDQLTSWWLVGEIYHYLRPFQVVGLGSSFPINSTASRNLRYWAPIVRQPAREAEEWPDCFFKAYENLVVFYQPIWKIWGPKFRGENQLIFGHHHLSVSPIGFPFLDRGVKPLWKTSSIYGEGERLTSCQAARPTGRSGDTDLWHHQSRGVASSWAEWWVQYKQQVNNIISKQQVFVVAYVAFNSRINLSIFYIWTFWTIWFYPAQQRSSRICDHDPWGVIASNEQLGIFRRSHRLTLSI